MGAEKAELGTMKRGWKTKACGGIKANRQMRKIGAREDARSFYSQYTHVFFKEGNSTFFSLNFCQNFDQKSVAPSQERAVITTTTVSETHTSWPLTVYISPELRISPDIRN